MELNRCINCGNIPDIKYNNIGKNWSVECKCGLSSFGLPSQEYAENLWQNRMSNYHSLARFEYLDKLKNRKKE